MFFEYRFTSYLLSMTVCAPHEGTLTLMSGGLQVEGYTAGGTRERDRPCHRVFHGHSPALIVKCTELQKELTRCGDHSHEGHEREGAK